MKVLKNVSTLKKSHPFSHCQSLNIIVFLGNYLYFEASSPAQPQQTSCFFSQDFPGGMCQRLTFWYHMLGAGIGELNVLLKSSSGTSTVWQKIGEQGDQWIQASVEIRKDEQYKVIMMIRGGGGLKTRSRV